MPVQSRLVGDDLLVDNVDVKRAARTLLQMTRAADWRPPKDINQAMEIVARMAGFPNLHAAVAQAQRGPQVIFEGSLDQMRAEDVGAAWQVTPQDSGHAAWGSTHAAAVPEAMRRMATERTVASLDEGTAAPINPPLFVLRDGFDHDDPAAKLWVNLALALCSCLNQVIIFLYKAGALTAAGQDQIALLSLDGIESMAWELPERFGVQDAPEVASLRSYLLHLPDYRAQRYQGQSAMTQEQHSYVSMMLVCQPEQAVLPGPDPSRYAAKLAGTPK